MISIQSNGSKWAGDSPDPLDALEQRLQTHTLDPISEAYGNFIMPRDGAVTRFWGNFYDLSAVFSVDTDEPDTAARLTAAIRANQATPSYAKAKAEIARGQAQAAEWQRVRDIARATERRRQALAVLELESAP